DENHFRLDKLLNRTEQDLQALNREKQELKKIIAENEKLNRQLTIDLNKEKHRQQIEILNQQKKITGERIEYLKDMERKIRQVILEWKKSEKKEEVVKQIQE